MSFIYLAGPYTHTDKKVREQRYKAHRKEAISWIRLGYAVFSPIVHSHNLLPEMKEFKGRDWLEFDLKILKKAEAVIVLGIEGWETSIGTQMEIAAAKVLGIPIHYLKGLPEGENRTFIQVGPGAYRVDEAHLFEPESAVAKN